MWIKVFVKALPNTVTSLINSCLAVPLKTIFAFLMLNTMSSAHNKIFGAKFLSFERVATMFCHSVDYAAMKRNAQQMTEQNKHHWVAIEPLLHSNTATVVIQKRHYCTLIGLLLEGKRGCIDKSGCHKRNKTAEKRLAKSLKPIFIL